MKTKTNPAKTVTINSKEIVTKETIELEVPKLKERVRITVTKKHFFDPVKKKMITDQVIHRARYKINEKENGRTA